MTTRWVFGMMFALAATGCGACPGRSDAPEQAAPSTETATGAAEHDDDNELEVALDMLRDLRLTTAPVETRKASGGVATILGELDVNQDAYAEVAAALSGRVTRVTAGLGDRVAAGQALAEVHSAELGRARGAMLMASARLTLARAALERKRGLAADRVVPEREVQEAQAELAASQAEWAAADATMQALGLGPQDGPVAGATEAPRFVVRSPISGQVIARSVVLGQSVGADSGALFVIADLSRLWLTVHAFERDAVRIEGGAEVEVNLAALPGRVLKGRVDRVGGRVDPASRTVPVRIVLANAGGVLRPGMSASARVPMAGGAGETLVVPTGALQRLGDTWVVFIPKDPGHFEIRPVGRGRDLASEVEVLSGLRAGDRVVVDGSFVLKAEAEKARGLGESDEH